ncbi:MAG: hypothetical protein EYC70_15930 [Planctomycetota bacterium]|nr:MAG: hypothetical protein EYC70_15930 [Planctomycetota bacterium]
MGLRPRPLAVPLCVAVLASAGAAQGGGGQGGGGLPPGVTREQMWPAPSAEDWMKPCLITWQRSYEDALAVSKETGKPILVCVNMDGEIASEHYAGVRYRQPEIAKLYEPYVCVIASVYRHSPRDYDEQGRRIPCPRFGGVTCGEHIAIEPVLYEKFFEGRRIAPRHIAVELDGQEQYDVYYAWDTDTIFNALRDGVADRPSSPPVVRGDRSILEQVASRDVADRTTVEAEYLQGDRARRRALLEAALARPDAAPVDLLRLAAFGFDAELGQLARRALAASSSPAAVDLIAETLRVPLEAGEREALIAALERIGASSPRARTLAVVHQGLDARSSALDVEDWSESLAGAEAAAASDWYALESRLDSEAARAAASPGDAQARLELAEASLALAVDPKTALQLAADRRTATRYARLMFEDAQRAALEAERLGATGWRVQAALALAAHYLGDFEQARARAEAAVAELPPGEQGWNAMAVLALFADARRQAVAKAVREQAEWPAQWLTDVHAAYAVLARHPYGTDALVLAHHDFLKSLGAADQAARVLEDGLDRFPDSWGLHERLRAQILEQQGLEGLEAAYEARLRREDAPRNLEWFAGYASLVAAEFHRRKGEETQALAAYGRAIAHYERGIEVNPDTRAAADHYVALAHAGRARLAYERADYEEALAELLASFARKPEAAASHDGLSLSPVATAQMLLARLTSLKRDDLAVRLQAALDALDPALLLPPAFERELPDRRDRDPRRRRTEPGR